MESQCLININFFIKTKNHSNHLKNIFAFFEYVMMYIFLSQIYFGITQYKLEKRIFFLIEVLWFTILCKKNWKNILQNYHGWSSNMDTPKKQYNVTTFSAPPSVLSPSITCKQQKHKKITKTSRSKMWLLYNSWSPIVPSFGIFYQSYPSMQ
jgi:hypothetical protein